MPTKLLVSDIKKLTIHKTVSLDSIVKMGNTDYGLTKTKFLILCGPNNYLGCGYAEIMVEYWKTWTRARDLVYQIGY